MEKTCKIEDCLKTPKARGWCQNHYMQFWYRGFGDPCKVEECSLPPEKGARYCAVHRPVISEKRCPRCSTVKPVSKFARNARARDGYRSWCKACHAESDRVPCPDCGKPKSRRSAQCGACAWTKRGPDAANWRGGRTHSGEGYILVQVPDHPGATPRGYVKEHRLVMESVLGRYLVSGENVHHINGVKDDNRPENLELWVTKQPKGQRVEDLVEWAKEILVRYDSGA